MTEKKQRAEKSSPLKWYIAIGVVVALIAYALQSTQKLTIPEPMGKTANHKVLAALEKSAPISLDSNCRVAVGYDVSDDIIVNATALLTSLGAEVHGQLDTVTGLLGDTDALSRVFSGIFEGASSQTTGISSEFLQEVISVAETIPGVRHALGGFGGVAAQEFSRHCQNVLLGGVVTDEMKPFLGGIDLIETKDTKVTKSVVMDSYYGDRWGFMKFTKGLAADLRLISVDDQVSLDMYNAFGQQMVEYKPTLVFLTGAQTLGGLLNRYASNNFYESVMDQLETLPKSTLVHTSLTTAPKVKTILDVSETLIADSDSVSTTFHIAYDWIHLQQTAEGRKNDDQTIASVDKAANTLRTLHHAVFMLDPHRTRNLTRVHMIAEGFQIVCHQRDSIFAKTTKRSAAMGGRVAQELSCGDDIKGALLPINRAIIREEGTKDPIRLTRFNPDRPVTCYDDGPLNCCIVGHLSCPMRPMSAANAEERIAAAAFAAAVP